MQAAANPAGWTPVVTPARVESSANVHARWRSAYGLPGSDANRETNLLGVTGPAGRPTFSIALGR